MQAHRHRARTLAEDRHLARVAAEGRDVLGHPAQRQALVQDAVIAGKAQFAAGQEAQGTQAVVERHHDQVAGRGEVGAVIDRQRAGAEQEGAAMDEHHDRQPLAPLDRGARRPDVEEQAVLGVAGGRAVLRAYGAERDRLADTGPGWQGLRWRQAQVAHRRLRVGDAAIAVEGASRARWRRHRQAADHAGRGRHRADAALRGGRLCRRPSHHASGEDQGQHGEAP